MHIKPPIRDTWSPSVCLHTPTEAQAIAARYAERCVYRAPRKRKVPTIKHYSWESAR